MPAYHSNFASCQQSVGNFAILPLKTKFRGPANANSSFASDSDDIIDETLNYFKANVFFRTYEIKSEADRVLIYITLYITECLKVLQKCSNKQQGLSMLYNLALSKFDIPGDPNFPLNSVYLKPESPYDADLLKSYLIQLRQETGVRLCDKVFNSDDEKPSTDNPCKHVNVVSTLKLNFQRSTNVDDDDLRALVDSNPCTTVQELAEELGVSKSTISEHLNRIGKSKKLDKRQNEENEPLIQDSSADIDNNSCINSSSRRRQQKNKKKSLWYRFKKFNERHLQIAYGIQ